MDEIVARLKQGPVTFRLKAQLAAPGDQTSDPAKPWPDDRPVADLGVLTIDKAVADSREAEKPLLFLPGQVIDGIELSDDPLVSIRDGAYAESFSRRNPCSDRARRPPHLIGRRSLALVFSATSRSGRFFEGNSDRVA